MKKIQLLFTFLLIFFSFSIQAQTSFGGEIVSYQKFGEGLMVTRARIVPLSGVVSNFFFYNRADQPWNGNVWYEYDWEIRGRFPSNGWSQIRVRSENGGQLRDAPVNISTSTNLGNKLLHYILIRKGDDYIYDIRENFNINNYNYNNAGAHGGNSVSLIVGGPRIYTTGGNVADIPSGARLDYSLGVTAFDNSWAGSLPNGSYSEEMIIDYTRFYGFSGNNLNTSPQWQDEFNNNSLDHGKWQVANWTFAVTQFTQDNIRFEDGKLYLRINRGTVANTNTNTNTSTQNLALSGQASQSTTRHGGDANKAIDNNTNGNWSAGSITHTATQNNAWWQVELAQTSEIDRIEIYNRTNCCSDRLSNFTVSVLNENDAVVWSQFYANHPSPSLSINLDAVGKSVRVNLNGTLSLAEVKVYGTAGNSNNNNNETGGNSENTGSNIVHITKRNSTGHALDGGNGGKNGQNVYLWGANQNNVNQQWVEFDRGNGYYSYQKMNSNFCLDGGNGGSNNQNLYLWTCNANNQNQQWQKVNAGGGSYKLVKRNAPYAIDGSNGGANGQNVKLWTSSSNNQDLNWFLTTIGVAEDRARDETTYSNFIAQKESGRKVELTWIVDHIRTPIQYEIEYKNTVGVFEVLDVVAAIAEEDYQVYNFVHETPESGDNTYRIKAVFADYTIVYLDPQMVSFDADNSTMIFPNPSVGVLFVNLADYLEQEVKVTLTDLSGKSYYTKNFDSHHASMVEMDMSTFDNGFYMLYIKAKNRQGKVEKISLQRTY